MLSGGSINKSNTADGNVVQRAPRAISSNRCTTLRKQESIYKGESDFHPAPSSKDHRPADSQIDLRGWTNEGKPDSQKNEDARNKTRLDSANGGAETRVGNENAKAQIE